MTTFSINEYTFIYIHIITCIHVQVFIFIFILTIGNIPLIIIFVYFCQKYIMLNVYSYDVQMLKYGHA